MDWKQLYQDFKQKYEKCYCSVLLEGYNIPKVFYLEFVEETLKAPLLHLRNNEFGEVILKYDDSCSDVSFKLPNIGLYNSMGNVLMVRRLYQRQFKKGICTSTLYIKSIYQDIYSGFVSASEANLHESLVKILLQPTPTLSLKEGIDALDKVLATALSPEFAVGLSPRLDGVHILWYYENPIGLVDPVGHRIFLKENQFQQEFQDFVAKIRGADDFSIYS